MLKLNIKQKCQMWEYVWFSPFSIIFKLNIFWFLDSWLEKTSILKESPTPLLDPPCLLMPTSLLNSLLTACTIVFLLKRSDPEITQASLLSDKTTPEPKPILYNCYYCILTVILPGICTLEQEIMFYGLLVDNVWNQISVFIISEVLLWVLLCKPYKQGYGWCYSVFVLSTNPIKRPKLNNVSPSFDTYLFVSLSHKSICPHLWCDLYQP